MLRVENEYEDMEQDWFEIQSNRHSKLRRIAVKRLWMKQFDLKIIDLGNDLIVVTDETIQIGVSRPFDI